MTYPVNWDIQPEETMPWAEWRYDLDESELEEAGYGQDELTDEEAETIYDFGGL